jgi:hypothetical protein
MVLPHGAFFLSRSQNHIPITMDEIHQMWLLAEFILEDGFPSKTGNSCDGFPSGISMKRKP